MLPRQASGRLTNHTGQIALCHSHTPKSLKNSFKRLVADRKSGRFSHSSHPPAGYKTLCAAILCGYYITAFSKKTTSIHGLSAIPSKFAFITIRFIPFWRNQNENSVVWLLSWQAAQTAALAQQINQRCGNFRAVAQIPDGNERRLLARIHDALRGGLAQPGQGVEGHADRLLVHHLKLRRVALIKIDLRQLDAAAEHFDHQLHDNHQILVLLGQILAVFFPSFIAAARMASCVPPRMLASKQSARTV